MALPKVTTKRIDERGRLSIRVNREQVGEVFPVAGGWQWSIGPNALGLLPRDTSKGMIAPYRTQGEAEDAAKKYVRASLRVAA